MIQALELLLVVERQAESVSPAAHRLAQVVLPGAVARLPLELHTARRSVMACTLVWAAVYRPVWALLVAYRQVWAAACTLVSQVEAACTLASVVWVVYRLVWAACILALQVEVARLIAHT